MLHVFEWLDAVWSGVMGYEDEIQLFCALFSTFLLGGITLYFAWQQTGYSFSFNHSLQFNRITAPYFGNITLINLKNRPVSIFEIWAVLDNTYVIDVASFKDPHIIPPLGSWSFSPEPITALLVGGTPLSFKGVHSVDIFVGVPDTMIRCKPMNRPLPKWEQQGYLSVVKLRLKFNERVYSQNVLYAIVYGDSGGTKTAFVDSAGLISGDWPFRENGISQSDLSSADSVKGALDKAGFDKRLGIYSVSKLNHNASPD